MKLNFGKIETSASAEFESAEFDIGNKAVIMEILRGKMYSDPIKIICQEIMSNARDAHREVGKHRTPIEVVFPTMLDPVFIIRDFGPGITPQRMSEIFVMYGNSTKRDSDKQTGGFGLGSKTPFAYTDTFTVISITPDENNQFIKREYVAYIDDSRLGVMSLVNEEPTEDKRGTSIIITPKQEDFSKFVDGVEKTARHWDVKPRIINNDGFFWKNQEKLFSGKGWEIVDARQPNKGVVNIRSESWTAVVDGIMYELDKEIIINNIEDRALSSFTKTCINFIFKTGDVEVTATREDLDYREKTINKVVEVLKTIKEELPIKIEKSISNSENLREAYHKYRDFFSMFSFLKNDKIAWNGVNVPDIYGGIDLTHPDYEDGKKIENGEIKRFGGYEVDEYVRSWRNEDHISKATRSHTDKVYLDAEVINVENDGVNNIRNRCRVLLHKNKKPKRVFVFKTLTEEEKSHLQKHCHWDLLDIKKLSDYTPEVIKISRTYSRPSKVKIYGLNDGWRKCKDDEIDDKEDKFYLELKGRNAILEGFDRGPLDKKSLRILDNIYGKLYGVFTHYSKKLDKTWNKITIEKINKIVEHLEKSDEIKMYLEYGDAGTALSFLSKSDIVGKVSENSFLLKYFEYSDIFKSEYFISKVNIYVGLKSNILSKFIPIREPIDKKTREVYPLIEGFNTYYMRSKVKDILLYINAKDKFLEEREKENKE